MGYFSTRRQLKELNDILDRAISGDFQNKSFDESEVSKLSAKLARYLAAAKLRRSDLEEDNKAIQSLISDISHQTRTPATNISIYTQLLLERTDLSDDARALVEQIHTSSEKLSFLVESLVKSSRLETGVITINPQNLPISSLIEQAVSDVAQKAAQNNITLNVAKNIENSGIHALYDSKWTREAVYNILDNAVKYTDKGGCVNISVEQYEMFSCISIADTGKGICENDLPKVFTRFFRSADTAEVEGIGIGLYLAREIVGKCGGYISAKSVVGKGSTFFVFLSKL